MEQIQNIKVFYRISDKGRPKEKLLQATKQGCLENAIAEFGKENIYVIADNCESATIQYITELGLPCEETSLGNRLSFQHMCRHIFATCEDDTFVYLLEDDYIHLPGARRALLEGLSIADYVTLYDHPDKYHTGGVNPLTKKKLEKTILYITKHSHWRETNSTTMTFATKAGILKKDFPVWEKHTSKGAVPDDFGAFIELTEKSFSAFCKLFAARFIICFKVLRNMLFHRNTRKLISAVPSFATHAEVDQLAPVIEWEKDGERYE